MKSNDLTDFGTGLLEKKKSMTIDYVRSVW